MSRSESEVRIEVVAAVLERDGSVLMAQRDARSPFAGMWEFPGGKVESGESREEALCREIREELGVSIAVRNEPPVAVVRWDYDHALITLVALRADIVDGTPEPLDHQVIRWIAVNDLTHLKLLPADVPVALLLETGERENSTTEQRAGRSAQQQNEQ